MTWKLPQCQAGMLVNSRAGEKHANLVVRLGLGLVGQRDQWPSFDSGASFSAALGRPGQDQAVDLISTTHYQFVMNTHEPMSKLEWNSLAHLEPDALQGSLNPQPRLRPMEHWACSSSPRAEGASDFSPPPCLPLPPNLPTLPCVAVTWSTGCHLYGFSKSSLGTDHEDH